MKSLQNEYEVMVGSEASDIEVRTLKLIQGIINDYPDVSTIEIEHLITGVISVTLGSHRLSRNMELRKQQRQKQLKGKEALCSQCELTGGG